MVILNSHDGKRRLGNIFNWQKKTSFCHKGPLKNSTSSCPSTIPLTNIYRYLVIQVSPLLLIFTSPYPGLIPFPNLPQVTHVSCGLSMVTPIYLPVHPYSINGAHVSPHLLMPGVFTPRYPHLTPSYPRLFYTIQETKPPESAMIGVS